MEKTERKQEKMEAGDIKMRAGSGGGRRDADEEVMKRELREGMTVLE